MFFKLIIFSKIIISNNKQANVKTEKKKSCKMFNKSIYLHILLIVKNTKMSETNTKVKAIIVDKLGVDESEVTETASFTDDLGADSLDTVELIMEFEKEFDIQIPDDKAEKIVTVGDAINYIESA